MVRKINVRLKKMEYFSRKSSYDIDDIPHPIKYFLPKLLLFSRTVKPPRAPIKPRDVRGLSEATKLREFKRRIN